MGNLDTADVGLLIVQKIADEKQTTKAEAWLIISTRIKVLNANTCCRTEQSSGQILPLGINGDLQMGRVTDTKSDHG